MSPSSFETISPFNITETKALWKSEPKSRGTFSILSICLSTIFICVWKARHPDMPKKRPEDRNWTKGTLLSVWWFVFYLFGPEGLVSHALYDLRAAWILYYNVNQLDHFPPPRFPWYSRWILKRIIPMRHPVSYLPLPDCRWISTSI